MSEVSHKASRFPAAGFCSCCALNLWHHSITVGASARGCKSLHQLPMMDLQGDGEQQWVSCLEAKDPLLLSRIDSLWLDAACRMWGSLWTWCQPLCFVALECQFLAQHHMCLQLSLLTSRYPIREGLQHVLQQSASELYDLREVLPHQQGGQDGGSSGCLLS